MSHEQLSAKATSLYEQHGKAVSELANAQERRLAAGTKLRDARTALDNARDRHDRATDRYLRGGSSISRVRDLKSERYFALDDHTRADEAYHTTGGRVYQAERDYKDNLSESAAHYNGNDGANTNAYHEMAIQEARLAGVEVEFSGDVATNVRSSKEQ